MSRRTGRRENVEDLGAWRRRRDARPRLRASQRLVYLLGGLVFVSVATPLVVLLGWGVVTVGKPGGAVGSSLPGLVLGLAVMGVILAVGIDLMLRGISGRYWSERFWMRANVHLLRSCAAGPDHGCRPPLAGSRWP